LPNVAQFCLKCGSAVIVAPVPAVTDVISVPLAEPKAVRPYRWGLFQGWSLVLMPPLLALIGFATASTANDYDVARGEAIASVLTVPMGVGILRKRRYGLILVYVTLVLICLAVVIGFL